MELSGARVVGGQHGYRHLTAALADGREVFVKAAEQSGNDSWITRRLRRPGGVTGGMNEGSFRI
ncbi:MAG: hypothetical protein ACRDN0_22920 [Trebonia sp.]